MFMYVYETEERERKKNDSHKCESAPVHVRSLGTRTYDHRQCINFRSEKQQKPMSSLILINTRVILLEKFALQNLNIL